jgi:hypothetical protein
MDDTYLLNKMKIVRAIGEIPRKMRDIIERINALRNAIAHSFFPENRRQYASHKKVMYQGENVYTRNGIQKFEEDFKVVNNYLIERAFVLSNGPPRRPRTTLDVDRARRACRVRARINPRPHG